MSRGLEAWSSKRSAVGAASRGETVPGRDVAAQKYGEPYVGFDDLPTTFLSRASGSGSREVVAAPRVPAGALVVAGTVSPPRKQPSVGSPQEVLSSGVVVVEKPRRTSVGVVQRRVGWQAHINGITIVTVERPLDRRADGKYVPVGEWGIAHRQLLPATCAPARRTGTVAPDPHSAQSASTRADSMSGVAPSEFISAGLEAVAFLPEPVRRSVSSRANPPVLFDGATLLWTPGGAGEKTYQVRLVKVSAAEAIAVFAERPVASGDPWEVTQCVYTLGDPVTEIA